MISHIASSLSWILVLRNEALYHLLLFPLHAQVREKAVYLGNFLRIYIVKIAEEQHMYKCRFTKGSEHLRLMILSKLEGP
jgi:hypothetical protein